jgi:hypothetical protein
MSSALPGAADHDLYLAGRNTERKKNGYRDRCQGGGKKSLASQVR